MPSVLSSLTNKQKVATGMAGGLAAAIFIYYRSQLRNLRNLKSIPSDPHFLKEEKAQKKKERIQVDSKFFRELWKIMKILVPGVFSKEAFYLALVAAALLGRTYADIWMIMHSTKTEKSIIDRDPTSFSTSLVQYVVMMPALSVINNLLKFGLSELKLRFRTQLTKYLYGKYLNNLIYYKMSNLDNRISNADQLLTQDVEKFCAGIVELYSNLSKPILDVILYVYRLGNSLGLAAPMKLFAYLLVSGLFLTRLRRPIGKMTAQEQHFEGEFRFVNSRLITNSEEVAFYQGSEREKSTLMGSFEKLEAHLRNLILFKFNLGFVDNIIAKYVATFVGWWTISRPFLDKENDKLMKMGRNELMMEYYNSGRIMFKLAEALGRLALAGREMTQLAGYTSRMSELMSVMRDLGQGHYQRTMVGDVTPSKKTVTPDLVKQSESDSGTDNTGSGVKIEPKLGSGSVVLVDNLIRFENVPLITPNGDILVNNMSFEVKSGVNVLVCGPNGCGKSSLFRILGGLWPLFGGTLYKPERRNLFYIPQRPYMTIGTLRDQVIYPDTIQDMKRKGIDDSDLEWFLDLIQLRYILDRESGWDSVQDWMDVLSGGEKQRIAMARLFYHKPQFAILDECTSAVSVDVEGKMYQYCRTTGITLFTVSHRKSLWAHHEYYLYMDGRGTMEFKPIDKNTEEFGS